MTLKNKPIGMLIMILALVLVATILIVVIVASAGGEDETTPFETTTEAPVTPDDPTSTSTTATTTTETPTSTTEKPLEPAKPTPDATDKADATGVVTVPSANASAGLLIDVNATTPYNYDIANRFMGDHNSTTTDVEAAGYYRFSDNPIMRLYAEGDGHFLRQDAYKALVSMLTTFDSVSGVSSAFIFKAYTASTSTSNTLVTGNVLQVKNGDYAFNYSAYKVTVNGESMTYEKWFKENCAQYGFIYEGMVDSMRGEFRYVGTTHAAGITAAGSLSAYLAGIKAGTITSVTVGEETWNLSYVQASAEENTQITVGANATYTVSGDNNGGFIVAVLAK